MTKRLSPAHRAYRKRNQKRRDENMAKEVEAHIYAKNVAVNKQLEKMIKAMTGEDRNDPKQD